MWQITDCMSDRIHHLQHRQSLSSASLNEARIGPNISLEQQQTEFDRSSSRATSEGCVSIGAELHCHLLLRKNNPLLLLLCACRCVGLYKGLTQTSRCSSGTPQAPEARPAQAGRGQTTQQALALQQRQQQQALATARSTPLDVSGPPFANDLIWSSLVSSRLRHL